VNLTTKFGETNGFRASDFVNVLEKYLGRGVLDYAAVSGRKPSASRLRPYALEKSAWVEFDRNNFGPRPRLIAADLMRPRGFVRHDPERIAKLIMKLAKTGNLPE
jgi:2-phospho-L-lactate transferase/gluconeogenesis factor (CofD/UPF0052 family)